jgi:hypothetical protein
MSLTDCEDSTSLPDRVREVVHIYDAQARPVLFIPQLPRRVVVGTHSRRMEPQIPRDFNGYLRGGEYPNFACTEGLPHPGPRGGGTQGAEDVMDERSGIHRTDTKIRP